MQIDKLNLNTSARLPLMAVLPYGIQVEPPTESQVHYDPVTQLTRFAGRDFSTCREDESAGHIFQSKSDTKKDD